MTSGAKAGVGRREEAQLDISDVDVLLSSSRIIGMLLGIVDKSGCQEGKKLLA